MFLIFSLCEKKIEIFNKEWNEISKNNKIRR